MTIPNIFIPDTGVTEITVPNSSVLHPTIPYVPVTVDVGKPIVDMPGCVEVHKENKYPDGTKNKQLAEDDDTITICDAGMPSYDAIDYTPDQLTITREIPPPPVEPPPDPPTSPEVKPPNIPQSETECPAPNQPRVGDLTQNGEEKVIGHELQGTTCVVLYEPTTTAEKFLPSTNQVSVTAAIAVVATASAAATPLLLRLIKPIIKKLTTTAQKKLGRHRELSKSEIIANRYRQSKGLPPLKPRKR